MSDSSGSSCSGAGWGSAPELAFDFEGMTLWAEEMVPIFVLRRILRGISEVLRGIYPDTKLLVARDTGGDARSRLARRSSWHELDSVLNSDDCLHDAFAGYPDAQVALFPETFEFLIRYYIPSPRRLGMSSLGHTWGFFIPVPHEQPIGGRWGQYDVKCSPGLRWLIMDACLRAGSPEPKSVIGKVRFLHEIVLPDSHRQTIRYMERELTPDVMRLALSLYENGGFWYGIQRRSDLLADTLREIGSLGDCAVVPFVLPFVFIDCRPVAEAAAWAIGRLLELRDSRRFLHCVSPTSAMGDPAGMNASFRWLGREGIRYLESFEGARTSLLGVASLHQSGYVREEAVSVLASAQDGSELPFLLVRMNDWEPSLRRVADHAVESRVVPEYAHHIVRNLGVLRLLIRSRRKDYADLFGRVQYLLRLPRTRSALFEGLASPDVAVRRACYRIALSLEGSTQAEMVLRASADDDISIRSMAAHAMTDSFLAAESPETLLSLAKSRYAPIRREALLLLGKLFPSVASELMLQAILDPNASVRSLAQHWLLNWRRVDVAQLYRDVLMHAHGARLRAAIEGLGEAGAASDAEIVMLFAAHPATRTRIAVIRALSALVRSGHADLFLRLLADRAPSVSHEARQALVHRPYLVSVDQLGEAFTLSTCAHVRRNVIGLITKRGVWESIPYLVCACCDPDENLRRSAVQSVALGLSRPSAQGPTPQQVDRIRGAIVECGNRLPDHLLHELMFAIEVT